MDVRRIVSWTSYLCIITALNSWHIIAIRKKLEKMAMKNFQLDLRPKCCSSDDWVLLDLGDVVIHLMSDQQRQFYDLESLYSAAEEISLEHYLSKRHPSI